MQRETNRPRCYELPRFLWGNIFVLMLSLLGWSCAHSPHAQEGHPAGLNRDNAEQDFRECEYTARLANDQPMYSQHSPFPFNFNAQDSADHARALHGLSSISAMRDTCLAAKGYLVE
ncbi:MAG: hypothetical protein QM706_01980 [Nitrospira sp.]